MSDVEKIVKRLDELTARISRIEGEMKKFKKLHEISYQRVEEV